MSYPTAPTPAIHHPSLCLPGTSPVFGPAPTADWVNICCLVLGFVGLGVSLAFSTVPTMPVMKNILAPWGDRGANIVSASFSSGTSLGEMIGPLFGSAMVQYTSWRWATTAYAGACLVLALVLAVTYSLPAAKNEQGAPVDSSSGGGAGGGYGDEAEDTAG